LLKIEGGAQANLNGGLTVGRASQGTVIVSSFGAPSQTRVRVKSDVDVGRAGRGIVQISDDAHFTVDGDFTIGFGTESPSGAVTVSPQSFLIVNGTLSVGGAGEGRLTADQDSLVSVHGSAIVGDGGLGILNVLNGSQVRCDELSVGGSEPAAVGIIVVGDSCEVNIAGNAQVGIGVGRGELLLTEGSSVLTIDGTMDIGNPSGGGGAGGAVVVSNATINGTGTIKVNMNGSLTGVGTINLCGGCRVDQGGQISPGLSPGLLTINGNYNQLASGVLIIEVAGLAPGQFDVLAVNGDVTLGGTLEIRFLDGFLPRQGDRIEFLNITGALSNNFAQIVLPQAAPGFDAELNLAPDGKLNFIARNDAAAGTGATITSPPLRITPRLRFTHFSLGAGQLTLAWTTTPGRSYRVEAKSDWNETAWTAVSTNIPADGGSLSISFNIPEAPHRFYRIAQSESQ
jgi:hypothetical protein